MENNNGTRPRRKRIGGDDRIATSNNYSQERSRSPRPSYGSERSHEDRPYGSSERRSNFTERRSFNGGERHSNGERSSFRSNDSRRPSGDRKPFGAGPRRQDGERRSFDGERRPYADQQNSTRERGERRSFSGERRHFADSPRPSHHSENRFYGNNSGRRFSADGERRSFNPDGERRPFNRDRQGGERRGFNSDRRPSFGGRGRQGASGQNRTYRNEEASGIDKMIDKRSQKFLEEISQNNTGDADKFPVKDVIRLNKFISNSGICSRREADNYIIAGVVTVNGEVVTELGSKVNIYEDDVRFNGERLKGEEKVYIVMNKPKGYVTTASDPHADKTVTDLLKGCTARVFPVGRLDKNTTGVLMFTNDGEIAEKLTHPSYDKKKIYQVNLDNDLKKEDYDKIMAGITLTDGEIAADDLEYVDEKDHRKIGIEIHSGKNHIVRRIFESLGYTVKALDRVYFAGLTKKGLKRGEWRYLTLGETNILKMGSYK